MSSTRDHAQNPGQQNRPTRTDTAGGALPRPGKANPNEEQMEERLAEHLPDQTDPAQEWGERLEAGKGVATGGESAARPRTTTGEESQEATEE